MISIDCIQDPWIAAYHLLCCRLHGPLARYVKLWVAHAPAIPRTFFPPPRVSDPDMHHGTCVTHVPWYMLGSLTSGFLWSRWRGKRSRRSWCMRNPQWLIQSRYVAYEVTAESFLYWHYNIDLNDAEHALVLCKLAPLSVYGFITHLYISCQISYRPSFVLGGSKPDMNSPSNTNALWQRNG